MRTLALAAFVASLAISGSAFADAIQTGTASRAPVFAVASGNAAAVTDIGSASRAPAFASTVGTGQVVVQTGTATHAPVFALVQSGASLGLASR